jgi:hypothetical protein
VPTPLRVYLEQGRTTVFAGALDWPGWSRWGRSEEAALDELESYADRYRLLAARAGVRFPASHEPVVVDRVPGDSTTDFGAPSVPSVLDAEPPAAAELRRHVRLLQASWELLDELAVSAPETLRKGPRGGGRDRDAVLAHVAEAERAYARKVGVRHPPFREPGAVAALRADLVSGLLSGSAQGAWPTAYAVRRIAWHVLDHAWEIEDKS